MDKEETERLFAFDTTRLFANNVQAFCNDKFTMIVFREQANLGPEAAEKIGTGPTAPIARNIASIVLPTDVAREMAKQLLEATDSVVSPSAPHKKA